MTLEVDVPPLLRLVRLPAYQPYCRRRYITGGELKETANRSRVLLEACKASRDLLELTVNASISSTRIPTGSTK